MGIMMKIANVKAQSFNRLTGQPTMPKARIEKVDLINNEIFKGSKTVLEIKERYEAFWNYLNPRSEDVVFVHSIKVVP